MTKTVLFAALLLGLFSTTGRPQADVDREIEQLRKENELLRARVQRLEEALKGNDDLQKRLQALEALVKDARRPPGEAQPTVPAPATPSVAAVPPPPAPVVALSPEKPEKASSPPPVQVYGQIELDLTHDSNNSSIGGSLDTFGNTSFDLSPKPSRVGVRANGPTVGSFAMAARVETDFNAAAGSSTSQVIRLRHGYFTALSGKRKASFLFGQTDDLVGGITQVDSISFPTESYTGDIGNRRPQIRFEKWFDPGKNFRLRFQGALGLAVTSVQIIDPAEVVTVNVPMLEWRVAAETTQFGSKSGYVAVFGNWGHKRKDTAPTRKIDIYTWSYGAEANLWIRPSILFMGEIWRGVLMDIYRLNPLLVGINFTGQNTRSWGGWASVTWWLLPALRFNLGYGFDDPEQRLTDKGNSYTGFANFFYDFNKNWEVGMEVSRWRSAIPMQDGIQNKTRYQATFLYKF